MENIAYKISEVSLNYRACGCSKVEAYIRAVYSQCSYGEAKRRMAKLIAVIGGWDFSKPDGRFNRSVSQLQ